MKKILIIGTIALVVMAGIVFAILYFGQQAEPTPTPTPVGSLFPTPTTQVYRTIDDIAFGQVGGTVAQDEKVVIPTAKGDVVVNNVFKTAAFSSDERYISYKFTDEVEYSMGGGGDAMFIMTAKGNDSSLLVIENNLIKFLGITREDACKLNVLEYATTGGESHYVRSTFSFCDENGNVIPGSETTTPTPAGSPTRSVTPRSTVSDAPVPTVTEEPSAGGWISTNLISIILVVVLVAGVAVWVIIRRRNRGKAISISLP